MTDSVLYQVSFRKENSQDILTKFFVIYIEEHREFILKWDPVFSNNRLPEKEKQIVINEAKKYIGNVEYVAIVCLASSAMNKNTLYNCKFRTDYFKDFDASRFKKS